MDIRSRRIAAGWYEVETPVGTYTIELVKRSDEDVRLGFPRISWYTKAPAANGFDNDYATKREALEAVTREARSLASRKDGGR
jgi:hypothetical protein